MKLSARMIFGLCVLVLPTATHTQSSPDPYAILRQAYGKGDAKVAASAYQMEGTYTEIYAGQKPLVRAGRDEIETGFQQIFNQLGISANTPADLNFRLVSRRSDGELKRDTGYYRLSVGRGATQRKYFGQFATTIANGQFAYDVSGEATENDFELASGPVLFGADDEELSNEFYDGLTGVFAGQDGCRQFVTKSVLRLFLYNECTGDWRRLTRESGLNWTAGSRVIDASVTNQIKIKRTVNVSTSFTQDDRLFRRIEPFVTETIEFGSAPKLAGKLYLPNGPAEKRPAIVMVHGSGPQDRNGYASYIALIAQNLASSGMVVLTYDKRGTGLSGGNLERAGFDELSADAAVGISYLRSRPEVDASRIGLGGSSQAGWVVAKAIQNGAAPAFTMLIGAAGSALTVEEQNLYNTRVRMQCAGIKPSEISLALAQQRAFFAARRSARNARALAAISARANSVPAIRDWLFPSTVTQTDQPQWYDVLDPDFDPRGVWKDYAGQSFFMFGSLDDSTPSAVAIARLGQKKGQTVKLINGAQHLGLNASSLCEADITNASAFHKDFFNTLRTWASSL